MANVDPKDMAKQQSQQHVKAIYRRQRVPCKNCPPLLPAGQEATQPLNVNWKLNIIIQRWEVTIPAAKDEEVASEIPTRVACNDVTDSMGL